MNRNKSEEKSKHKSQSKCIRNVFQLLVLRCIARSLRKLDCCHLLYFTCMNKSFRSVVLQAIPASVSEMTHQAASNLTSSAHINLPSATFYPYPAQDAKPTTTTNVREWTKAAFIYICDVISLLFKNVTSRNIIDNPLLPICSVV